MMIYIYISSGSILPAYYKLHLEKSTNPHFPDVVVTETHDLKNWYVHDVIGLMLDFVLAVITTIPVLV